MNITIVELNCYILTGDTIPHKFHETKRILIQIKKETCINKDTKIAKCYV